MSGMFDVALTQNLVADLRRANTEAAKKERFGQYLTRLFDKDANAQALISELALGAEQTIANITRGGKSAYGRADTQTSTVIIEWEKDLARTGDHAVDQLREYLEGNWKSGREYHYVLIATDGLRWRVYAPDWSHLRDNPLKLGPGFQLKETSRFDLTAENAEQFPFFLDTTLFATTQKEPSASRR